MEKFYKKDGVLYFECDYYFIKENPFTKKGECVLPEKLWEHGFDRYSYVHIMDNPSKSDIFIFSQDPTWTSENKMELYFERRKNGIYFLRREL